MRARFALLLVFLLLPTQLFAAINPEALPDAKQEERALELQKQFRCVVCQGQSLGDSNAALAADMRALIRERIRQGYSDAEIADYLVRRYGDFVLMRPPLRGNTLLLWVLPFLVLIGGGTAVFFLLRRARKQNSTSQ